MEVKNLRDLRIQTDKLLENSRPYIMVLNKVMRKCILIDTVFLIQEIAWKNKVGLRFIKT